MTRLWSGQQGLKGETFLIHIVQEVGVTISEPNSRCESDLVDVDQVAFEGLHDT